PMKLNPLMIAAFVVGCSAGSSKASRDSTSSPASSAVGGGTAHVCGVAAGSALTGDGFAGLRVGRSVDEIHRDCQVVSDSTLPGEEALPERVVVVALGGDTARATIDSGRVWRISIASPAFETADSLHVGTPIARLLQR